MLIGRSKMKKIAVIGTHGVGKSTLCNALVDEVKSQRKKVELIGEVVRICPYPINQKMDYNACQWICLSQILLEMEAALEGLDVMVCDRSAYDPILYYKYINEMRERNRFKEDFLFDDLQYFVAKHLSTYDIFVLVNSSNDSCEGDGFRDTDKVFREKMDRLFTLEANANYPFMYLNKIYTTNSEEIFKDKQTLSKKILEKVCNS